MASSIKGKLDSPHRDLPDDALRFAEDPVPSDETPTIISKNAPTAEPAPSSKLPVPANKDKVTELHRPGMPSVSESMVNSLRGRKLAHFELIEPIGVGGMAAVIRARDTQLDRFVALKILPPDTAHDAENILRFHQEARAAAKLDHENIARVFFCGEDQGLHFIAFEFVEGQNLRMILEKRGRLPVPESIRYVVQVAAGLVHASSRGVVHRDVKPSNIIILPNGRAKLVDMGLARSMERRGDRDLTQSGVTLGTFDYISPEQAMEPRDADTRSDIYSLGCTLYHMLTGQPPVPDGTPAKKLHHHQQVAPIDPRQFNPQIPDEVAHLLSRMMAKNPRDRYQRPEMLVQHLMQVAKKVGATDDLPEGVLFLDAPMPEHPRSRPLRMVVLAMLLLAVVIVGLSLAPQGGQVAPIQKQPLASNDKGSGATPPEALPNLKPVVNPTPGRNNVIASAKELQAFLNGKTGTTQATLAGKISLDEISEGIVFQGESERPVVLKPGSEPGQTARLRFTYRPEGPAAAITVKSGDLVFQNLTFVLEAEATPEQAVALVAVRGEASVRFRNCTFIQVGVPVVNLRDTERVPLASVLVDAGSTASTERTRVVFQDCFFHAEHDSTQALAHQDHPGGQAALAVNGPASVVFQDAAFMPHASLVHFRSRCQQATTKVQMRQSAAFVLTGPAFRFDSGASADLQLENSIFSRPDSFLRPQSEANLVRQADDTPIRFAGRSNAYHNLNGLWTVGSTPRLVRYEDFVTEKSTLSSTIGDQKSLLLPDAGAGPWKLANPLKDRSESPLKVFEVKGAYYPLFGVKNGVWGEMPPPQFAKLPTLPRNQKIVDAFDKTPGVFKHLSQALAEAVSGDIILVKHGPDSQEVEVTPTTISTGIDVVIKPYEGHRPILVLNKNVKEAEPAFFRVLDGSLRLENLQFVLEPAHAKFNGQSVVQIGENASCTFNQCVATLKAAQRVPLQLVRLVDADELMRMDVSERPAAKVEILNSFIRGDGNLFEMRGCRPLDATVGNSVIVLAGSLLHVVGGAKDVPTSKGAQLHLSRVSAYLADPVLSLHTGRTTQKALARTAVDKADHCLFVALAPEQAFCLLDTMEALPQTKYDRFVQWKEGNKNVYVNFIRMLEHQQTDGGPATPGLDRPGWIDATKDLDARHETATFRGLQGDAVRSLWRTTPDQLKPADNEDAFAGLGSMLELDTLLRPPALAPVEP